MRIMASKTEEGWTLIRDEGKRVAIGGTKTWPTRAALLDALREKGQTLDPDNTVRAKKQAGRPPVYSAEEYKEHRRAKSREYSARRRKTSPEKVAEQAKAYREATPDQQKTWHQKSYEARKKRLAEDPEYRAKFNEYQRQWRARQKEQK